jgi:cysteinyl-tRNA synthetase
MQFNLSKLQAPRQTIKTRDYPKVKTILEEVDQLIKNAVASNEDDEEVVLSVDERKFYEAYDEHWVHAANRTVLTQYLCKQFTK